MVRNGFYRVLFGGKAYSAVNIFMLKDGHAVGFNMDGDECSGSYDYDPVRKLVRFEVVAEVQPNITLVTGQNIGATPMKVRLVGDAPIPEPSSRFSFDLGGRTVDVAMTFLRDLP